MDRSDAMRQPEWQATNAARRFKPSFWPLARFLLLFLVFAVYGAFLGFQQLKSGHLGHGFPLVVSSISLVVVYVYGAATGGFDMCLETEGLRIGKRFYPWASIRPGFTTGRGLQKNSLKFVAAGKRVALRNFYDMSTPALAALLNSRLLQGSNAATAPAPDYLGSTLWQGRKTLPTWAWILLGVLSSLLIGNIRPIFFGLWHDFAPASYASKMLSDEDLGNQAGFAPARAEFA